MGEICNFANLVLIIKIVSEYDQEIPQSQTADKPMSSPHNNHETPGRLTKQTKVVWVSTIPRQAIDTPVIKMTSQY